jgi:tetratricopeptide (TPR) repeat protein
MKRWSAFLAGLTCALVLASCTTSEKTAVTPPAPETSVSLEFRGHQLYATGRFDSASAVLQRLLALDPANKTALRDLGNLHFEQAAMDRDEKSAGRTEHLKTSRRYLSDLERQGEHDTELYDRLCEASLTLGDNKGFLTYAKKSVERYPFDRQYHNLGLAHFNVGDYQSAIKVEKEAIEKFRSSAYISSYYRLLGRAYMKVDRDQTAERALEEGLKIVNERLKSAPAPDDAHRMSDDKIGILISLKQLFTTYHKDEKLKEANRQLQEAGYTGK